MLLRKSDKGREELKPGMRSLGLRERGLLLLMDGNKTLKEIDALFNGEAEKLALQLLHQGYLEQVKPTSSFSPEQTGTFTVRTGVFSAAALQQAANTHAPAPVKPTEPDQTHTLAASDSFEGKRSLATTRMFLFDICERMFARRDKVMAEQFRESLRNAKDRESMLTAAREMIAEIERVAGHERADSISERIAMLLPPDRAA